MQKGNTRGNQGGKDLQKNIKRMKGRGGLKKTGQERERRERGSQKKP